jgi:hypothetical protein
MTIGWGGTIGFHGCISGPTREISDYSVFAFFSRVFKSQLLSSSEVTKHTVVSGVSEFESVEKRPLFAGRYF